MTPAEPSLVAGDVPADLLSPPKSPQSRQAADSSAREDHTETAKMQ